MAKIGKVEAARQEVQPVKGEIEALKHRLSCLDLRKCAALQYNDLVAG